MAVPALQKFSGAGTDLFSKFMGDIYLKTNLVPGWAMALALVRAHLRCTTFAAADKIENFHT